MLAGRLCGTPEADFHWQDSGTRLKVTGIALFSAGEPQASDHDEIWTSWDPLARHYRRLLVRDGKLQAVLLLGDCANAAPLTALLATPRSQTGFLILLQRSRALQVNFL